MGKARLRRQLRHLDRLSFQLYQPPGSPTVTLAGSNIKKSQYINDAHMEKSAGHPEWPWRLPFHPSSACVRVFDQIAIFTSPPGICLSSATTTFVRGARMPTRGVSR